MTQPNGSYRRNPNNNDPDRTQVDRSYTEEFGPSGAREYGYQDQTRTSARYEETGYVGTGGQAYQRDPRFDGQVNYNQQPPAGGYYPQQGAYYPPEEPSGFSLVTMIFAIVAALTIGVVGTVIYDSLTSTAVTPDPVTPIATVDPNAATPEQVTELNNQITALNTAISERDALIASLQDELAKVKDEAKAQGAAATTASQEAAEAQAKIQELSAIRDKFRGNVDTFEQLVQNLDIEQQRLNDIFNAMYAQAPDDGPAKDTKENLENTRAGLETIKNQLKVLKDAASNQ